MLIRQSKSKKERQYNSQTGQNNRQTMIYKALHRKLKIEQHEPHNKAGVNSGAPEG
jgi:hypothetical protein